MKRTPPITADVAKDLLGVTTREAVIAMIKRDELPGAYKADERKKTSPWLIPMKSIIAHPNYKKSARAKAEEAKARA